MKIIQSFWTKPFLRSGDLLTDARLNGGWPHRRFNYYSIALSYHHLRKFYDEVELVTDSIGYELLIEKLRLAYNKVSVELDHLDDYEPGLWALGKIYAYRMQESPFLHVDNDIFINRPFGSVVSEAALVAQNKQASTPHYSTTFRDICKRFPYVPGYLKKIEELPFVPCVNAGILGGSNIAFFRQYTEEVFEFINRNHDFISGHMDQFNSAFVNVVFEQVLFYSLSREAGVDIDYLFPDHNDNPPSIGYLHEMDCHQGYAHALGDYKKLRMVYKMVEHELSTGYPESFSRINDLLSVLEL
ncbi:hypothetical protein HGH92_29620 [Chitinophaga varians]|uniref:DUF6734 domain-containing protein n=1 Tax=Chitinophaga varians TaxID=2202339 RepID=A0A847RS73_9BACT|nr:DUF6734 family protein [Chitinophaga varians]NLR68500.1 hypothetical protein [Chitinophaga varians]